MHYRQFTLTFRIMHWAMALCFLLLLCTIFLRLTWLNKNNVADILNEQLTAMGVTLAPEQLVKIAKAIRKPMWDWHLYLGYVLSGLYVLRMLLPLAGEMKFRSPFASGQTGSEKFQAWLYVFFYLFLTFSLVTGVLVVYGPDAWHEPMEDLHKLGLWYSIPFVVLHLGGVLLSESRTHRGIVSSMFSGGQPEKQPR